MNEQELKEIQVLLEDRRKIAVYLRHIDQDRKENWPYWGYFEHKHAAEFLLAYRRRNVAEFLDGHLKAILFDIEMRIGELGVKPNPVEATYEKPKPTAGANGAIGCTWTQKVIDKMNEELKPHFYSGKTV